MEEGILIQFAVAATTGAFIVVYALGLRHVRDIFQKHKEGGGWKDSILAILNGHIGKWFSFLVASILTLVIIVGLLISIFLG